MLRCSFHCNDIFFCFLFFLLFSFLFLARHVRSTDCCCLVVVLKNRPHPPHPTASFLPPPPPPPAAIGPSGNRFREKEERGPQGHGEGETASGNGERRDGADGTGVTQANTHAPFCCSDAMMYQVVLNRLKACTSWACVVL